MNATAFGRSENQACLRSASWELSYALESGCLLKQRADSRKRAETEFLLDSICSSNSIPKAPSMVSRLAIFLPTPIL